MRRWRGRGLGGAGKDERYCIAVTLRRLYCRTWSTSQNADDRDAASGNPTGIIKRGTATYTGEGKGETTEYLIDRTELNRGDGYMEDRHGNNRKVTLKSLETPRVKLDVDPKDIPNFMCAC
jgi:hypothetical protein